MPSFTYLFIPIDYSVPIEERTLEYTEEDKVGCLTKALAKHFIAITSQAERDAAESNMMQQLKEEVKTKGYKVDQARMAALARTQMCHVETLLLGTARNNWETVSLYSDDSAVSKGFARNPRATQLALACGRSIQMLGDVFLARAQDDSNDLYHRLDIAIAEFAPDSEWVLTAKAESERRASNVTGTAGSAVSAKQLSKFETDLENWVQSKLAEWDESGTARKKHEKKHATREGFETHLRAKVKAKLDDAKSR